MLSLNYPMNNMKINLKGLNLAELQEFAESIGEKRYRGQQIFKWIYGYGIHGFDEMTNLSRALRQTLTEKAAVDRLRLVRSHESTKDGAMKFLFELQDGLHIEAVLMLDGRRTTLCVSTQAGCALDCKFCATGMMGLQRHLTAGEIVDQLLCVEELSRQRVSNMVCMGMGEPFHNYANVMKACELVSHDLGPNLAKRHIVVSTSGLVPKIIQYANENHKYRLAISLNATTDNIRSEIMPLNKKWPIEQLLNAAKYYTDKTGERVTFEYVLMDRINDSVEDAGRLKRLVLGIFCKINLIPYNATDGKFRRPSEARVQKFYNRLASLRAPVTIRWSKGDDIEAGCGQLAVGKLSG